LLISMKKSFFLHLGCISRFSLDIVSDLSAMLQFVFVSDFSLTSKGAGIVSHSEGIGSSAVNCPLPSSLHTDPRGEGWAHMATTAADYRESQLYSKRLSLLFPVHVA
jgi:hypothetical protein